MTAARIATVAAFLSRLEQLFLCCKKPQTSDASDTPSSSELVPGKNCQICESIYDNKFSTHVVVYAPGTTWALSAQVATTLNAILVHIPPSHSDHPLLVYKDAAGKIASVIDITIYGKGRCFRMMNMCKLKTPLSPLTPINGSSNRVVDHLVNDYPTTIIDASHTSCAIDWSAIATLATTLPNTLSASANKLVQVRRTVGISVRTDRPVVVADWQPSHINYVRNMLIHHEGLALELHTTSPLSFDNERLLSRRLYRFTLSKNSTSPWCPYGKRVHKSNNCFVDYNHDWQTCFLGCFDNDCMDKIKSGACPEFQLPVPTMSQQSAITAAIDATHQCDLHTRQHLVQWAQSYSDREMRPYPLDERLIVVRANTGVGEFFRVVELELSYSSIVHAMFFVCIQLLLISYFIQVRPRLLSSTFSRRRRRQLPKQVKTNCIFCSLIA